MSLKFTLAKTALTVLGSIPLSITRPVGRTLGGLLMASENRNVRIARRNIELCFPELSEAERQQLLGERMRALGQTSMEMLKIWGGSKSSVLSLVEKVEGMELLKEAEEKGKGTLVIVPHLGNWEVVGVYIPDCCSLAMGMYSPPKSPTLNQLILRGRGRTGSTLVPTDRSGVAQLLKALRQGGVVGILPDQVPTDEGGLFAPFFEHQAFTMTLLSNLARKTGASVINAYALPTEKGFKLVLSRPDEAIYSADLEQSVAGMNRTIEQCANKYRKHYQWEYKRFKRQKPGEASYYSG